MATRTPFEIISHRRRVCSLYKNVLRTLQDWCVDRALWRYEAVLMRHEFDKNKDIKDMRIAKKILEQSEEQHFQCKHYQPYKFPDSPGGVAYERVVQPPDSVLDFWDPVEKAFYPEYFAKREQRKKEYITNWEKKYGKLDVHQYKH